MRRRIAFVLAAAPACLFPSLSDLEGDAGDAQSFDVTLDAHDAFADVADPDAAAPIDAAIDTGPFCSHVDAALCEDFDEHLFSQQFTSQDFSTTTDAGADDAEFTSPPLSFFAHLAGVGGGHVAYMARAFTGTKSSIDFAFDLRVDQWVTGGASMVLAAIIVDENTPKQHEISFYVTDTFAALEEDFAGDAGNLFFDHKLSTAVMLGAWVRVDFRVDLAQKTCSASLDGNSALANTPIDPSWQTSGTPTAHLGISYVSAETAPWTVRYDDVVIDSK